MEGHFSPAPPHKLICSATATRELLDYGNGAEVLGTLLSEDIAVSLDAAILSAAPASSVRPAGILNSIASLTPTTGGNEAALRGDIALLAGVVGSTGSANVAFIVSPTYALKLRLEFGTVSKCSPTKLAK